MMHPPKELAICIVLFISGVTLSSCNLPGSTDTNSPPQHPGDPVTGYLNCDGSPTKTVCLERRGTTAHSYWAMSFGKRLEEELYNIKEDPECMQNLASATEHAALKKTMYNQMAAELTAQQDPRILGNGDIFDKYQYADEKHTGFYERYQAGETFNAGWVNESDFDSRDLGEQD